MASKASVMNGWKAELAVAAQEAARAIAEAARGAGQVITQAASDAKAVVSAQAARDAAKVNDNSRAENETIHADHDLLVSFTSEVREWKVVTTKRIELLESEKAVAVSVPACEKLHGNHEVRILETEKAITQIRTWGAALVFLVGVLEVIAQILITKLGH